MRERRWIRQTHRWVSIIFTTISAAIFVMLGAGATVPQWAYFLPLPPLALLVLTGLQMFVVPYFARHRSRATG